MSQPELPDQPGQVDRRWYRINTSLVTAAAIISSLAALIAALNGCGLPH